MCQEVAVQQVVAVLEVVLVVAHQEVEVEDQEVELRQGVQGVGLLRECYSNTLSSMRSDSGSQFAIASCGAIRRHFAIYRPEWLWRLGWLSKWGSKSSSRPISYQARWLFLQPRRVYAVYTKQ